MDAKGKQAIDKSGMALKAVPRTSANSRHGPVQKSKKKTVGSQETEIQCKRKNGQNWYRGRPKQIDKQISMEVIAMENEVMTGLTQCQPHQVMDVLSYAIKPDLEGLYRACMEIKADLLNIFGRIYETRVDVFGSSVMGTALKDSDFDFHVEILRSRNVTSSLVRDAVHILGPSGKFTKFVPIPLARIPILKCFHIRTGYNCDLNFSDSFGVYNSPILAALLKYDQRVYDMAIILKYWMKIHNLSGSNKISNYALLWLLIFYLQTIQSPIFPPIEAFQLNVPPKIIKGMNFAFNANLSNAKRNHQRQTELLLGFFEFYKSFDFESQIICPLHAKAFQRNNLLENHAAEFARYSKLITRQPERAGLKLNKPICIQDPFDIAHSLPGSMTKYNFQNFRYKLGVAAQIFKRELTTKGESGNLLKLILNRDLLPDLDVVKKTMMPTDTASFCLKILPSEADLIVVRGHLSKINKSSSVITAAEIRIFWAKMIIKYIMDMLINIFCLKLSRTYSDIVLKPLEITSKSPKVNGQSDVHTNELSKTFEVVGIRDVFYGRKQQKILMANFIRNEMEISKKSYLINQLPISLKAKVKLCASPETADCVAIDFVDMICTKKKNFFKGFQTIFSTNVNHYLKGYIFEFQNTELVELLSTATLTTPQNNTEHQTNDKTENIST